MMRWLALDTSSWWGSVALVEGDATRQGVVAEFGEVVQGTHARSLIGWIDRLLGAAGWERGTLDGFAAVRGPGSFTGVRIGLGTVAGLSLAADRPAVGIDSLIALAAAVGSGEQARRALLDAGRGEVYTARYDAASWPPVELDAPAVLPPEEALADERGRVVLRPATDDRLAQLCPLAPEATWEASPDALAGTVGRLALALGAEAREGTLEPLYLRPADVRMPG